MLNVNNTVTKKGSIMKYFEEKNGECAACLKYSVLIFVEKKYIYNATSGGWRYACPIYRTHGS